MCEEKCTSNHRNLCQYGINWYLKPLYMRPQQTLSSGSLVFPLPEAFVVFTPSTWNTTRRRSYDVFWHWLIQVRGTITLNPWNLCLFIIWLWWWYGSHYKTACISTFHFRLLVWTLKLWWEMCHNVTNKFSVMQFHGWELETFVYSWLCTRVIHLVSLNFIKALQKYFPNKLCMRNIILRKYG